LIVVSLGGTDLDGIQWPKDYIIPFGETSCCRYFIQRQCPIRFIKCDMYREKHVTEWPWNCGGSTQHTDLQKFGIEDIYHEPNDEHGVERRCCVLRDDEINESLSEYILQYHYHTGGWKGVDKYEQYNHITVELQSGGKQMWGMREDSDWT